MNYQLMAVDMDGTLLNSQKAISPEDAQSLNQALDLGKTVIFCTGRCLGELRDFFPLFPRMRYVLCESGALLYDLSSRQAIHRQSFDPETVAVIRSCTEKLDLMPQLLMDGDAVMNRADVNILAHFRMEHYRQHFEHCGVMVESVWDRWATSGEAVDKICLYHTSPEARAETRRLLEDLDVVMADTEATSLEISPLGVDKGNGLLLLCRHLSIPLEQTIAVGDSDNDLSVLRTAGLSVAMANASANVRSTCAVVVADNDHCGVAEAVERFLLR